MKEKPVLKPRKISPRDPGVAEQVVKLARLGLRTKEIYKHLEMPESSFYRIYSADLKEGRIGARSNVASALYENAMDGNFNAQKYYLESTSPEWVSQKPKLEESPEDPNVLRKAFDLIMGKPKKNDNKINEE